MIYVRNLFIILILLSATNNASIAASSEMSDQQMLNDSYMKIRGIVSDVNSHFKTNTDLYRFFSQNLYYYQIQRTTESSTIFPQSNTQSKEQKIQNKKAAVNYIINQDQKLVQHYKEIATLYCQYNSSKIKDKSMCSQQKLDKLFTY